MLAPTLNPVATPLPVAAVKPNTGKSNDVAADQGSKPEQDFAAELHRQIRRGDGSDNRPQPEQKNTTDSAAPSEDAATASNATPDPSLPPELAAALLAAALPPPAPPAPTALGNANAAAPGELADAALGSAAALPVAQPNPGLAALSAEGGQADSDGKGAAPGATPEFATPAANIAEDGAKFAASAAAAPSTAAAEPGPAKAPPAQIGTPASAEQSNSLLNPAGLADSAPAPHSFAALHAAALANLRGEATPAPSAPVPLHVATPAGSPGWPEEVGNRVSWMVGHAESHAELTLTPPQLGKLEVSITLSGDQTSAQIMAASPAVRDLLEQHLPRLREVLEQSGINLGQTDVGTSAQSGQSGEERRGANRFTSARGATDLPGAAVGNTQGWQRRGEGLVDTFA